MSQRLKKDELWVGNQLVKLVGIPNLIEKKGVWGEAEYWKGLIRYDSDPEIDIVLIEETIIHEVLEIVKATISDVKWKEWEMDLVARTIIQLLRQLDFSFFEDLVTEVSEHEPKPEPKKRFFRE